nr:hypothetical protein [uncultured Agathobaculum sp.]
MKGAQRSVKNTVKNISLLVLVGLLAILCAANWLTGINIAGMPADNLLRRAYDHLVGGAVGYELRSSGVAAAEPAQIALTIEGQLYGVQYNLTEVEAGVSAVRALWAQVLADGTLEPVEDETALTAALQAGDCALLRYHGSLPLGVIAGWMEGSWKQEESLAVESLVYTAGTGQLFVRTPDGALYAAQAEAADSTLQSAQQSFHGMPCAFAGGEYAVYPETLLFDNERLSLPLLEERTIDLLSAQSGTGLEGLLQAFGFTAYSDFYDEQNGAVRVFVDNASTLRVSAQGLLQYASSGEEGAVRAYEEGEVRGQSALEAQMDSARVILDEALRAGETDTHAALYAVQQSGEETTLVFMQMYSGVPVLGDSDFATFRFAEDGTLRSATIRLQRFAARETMQTVLPARQAAAGAAAEQRSMMVAYRAQDGVYVPARFYLQTGS